MENAYEWIAWIWDSEFFKKDVFDGSLCGGLVHVDWRGCGGSLGGWELGGLDNSDFWCFVVFLVDVDDDVVDFLFNLQS